MTDGSTAPVHRRPDGSGSWLLGVQLAVVASVVMLNLLQQPGLITFDTKLDLQLDPADLMARSLSLWNGDWALGGLQNQASGYLFPMGPVFLVGDVLDIPMWVWQRLWSAAVMLLAYEGARRLAARWPGIGTAGAILAGLTYMLAPRVLTTVGGLSGETLPSAVLPWTVLPLVLYLRGRLRGWVAFVLSAATIPWMGGQNATLVVACLVLPALLLVLASGRSVRRRLADLMGWGALVGVATLWWVVPLLLLGAYAPPFLDFIESADNTAAATGWLSSLRGTSHWVAFFPGGGQIGWAGGYELASSTLLVIPTVMVAALGLLGLLQTGLWERRVLAVSVLVGLAVLTAGSGGWAGSVFSEAWLEALDTYLAPLRNIHKFDPVVRLPLALGVGAFVTTAVPRTWRRATSSTVVPVRSTAVVVTGLLVLAAAGPAAAGSLRTEGGFDDMPDSWRDAVAYLREQPGATRTIVLPGAGFAVQTWGRTIDEPIQVLDPSPWMARAQVTVAPAGTLRLLDTVEQSVVQPRPQRRLAAALEALGATHVIVRNDLDPDETDVPSPELVRAAMGHVPGARVAGVFGSTPAGLPAIEVFELDVDDEPRVDVEDWEDRVVVDGGPEVVPDLRAAGLVADDQATVLAVDGEQADIVTDDLRRVERSFGRLHDARSGVMTSSDRFRVSRRAHDHSDGAMPAARTTAAYDGAAAIVASTSAGYADVLGPVRPEQHPYSAFDRSIYTAWGTAPLARPQGQWIEVRFDRPTPVRQVSLSFDTFTGAPVTSVRITTEDRSVVADVGPDGTAPLIDVDDDSATRMRVTVLGVGDGAGQVRLSDVRIADHDVARSLVLPGGVSAATSVYLTSEAPQRACAIAADDRYVGCELTRQVETSETSGFDRTITVEESGEWRLMGRVVATHGPAVERLFAPLSDELVGVTASTTYAGDPAVTASGAVDGRPETGWTSAPGDAAPALQLTWGPRRKVTGVVATSSPGQPGELPDALVVDGGPGTGEPQLVATSGPEAGEMRPVRTDQLRVTALGQAGSERRRCCRAGGRRHRGPVAPAGRGHAHGCDMWLRPHHRTRWARRADACQRHPPRRALGCRPGGRPVREAVGRALARDAPGACGEPGGIRHDQLGSDAVLAAGTGEREPTVRPVVVGDASEGGGVGRFGVSAGRRGRATTAAGRPASTASTCDPVVLDGWRQGFVLPAGTSGVVELDYGPQAPFRAALQGGLLLVGMLLLLAVLLLVRNAGRPAAMPTGDASVATVGDSRRSTRVKQLAQLPAVLVLGVVSLPLAVGALVAWATRHRSIAEVSAACAGALAFAGVMALSASAVVVPPVGSDVVVALVVGVVCGRVLVRP